MGGCAAVSRLPTLAGGQESKDGSGKTHTQLPLQAKRVILFPVVSRHLQWGRGKDGFSASFVCLGFF